jgi:hypothetical protein
LYECSAQACGPKLAGPKFASIAEDASSHEVIVMVCQVRRVDTSARRSYCLRT